LCINEKQFEQKCTCVRYVILSIICMAIKTLKVASAFLVTWGSLVLVILSLNLVEDSNSTSSYQPYVPVFLTSIPNHFSLYTIMAHIYLLRPAVIMLPVSLLVFPFTANLGIYFLILILTSACWGWSCYTLILRPLAYTEDVYKTYSASTLARSASITWNRYKKHPSNSCRLVFGYGSYPICAF